MKTIMMTLIACTLLGCSSKERYENDVMPSGQWYPINIENKK